VIITDDKIYRILKKKKLVVDVKDFTDNFTDKNIKKFKLESLYSGHNPFIYKN
jgi:hypothetical protein